MKKILVLLLAVTMLLGMVACAQNAEAPAETKDTETTAPTETTQNSATSDAETNESEDNAQAAGDVSGNLVVYSTMGDAEYELFVGSFLEKYLSLIHI